MPACWSAITRCGSTRMGMAERRAEPAELAQMIRASRRGACGRRARHFDRACSRRPAATPSARNSSRWPCAEAPQRRLFHPSPRRIEQGDRGGRGGDRHRPQTAASMSRSSISNAPGSTIGARPRAFWR